jgi:hypothetical protein
MKMLSMVDMLGLNPACCSPVLCSTIEAYKQMGAYC